MTNRKTTISVNFLMIKYFNYNFTQLMIISKMESGTFVRLEVYNKNIIPIFESMKYIIFIKKEGFTY